MNFIARLIIISSLLWLYSCSRSDKPTSGSSFETNDILDLVDPFIGTGGHGHTFPGATRPFGMVQCSPQTRLTGWDGCSGYHFSDEVVHGFAHTALSGTGVSDYGDVLIMPHLHDFTVDPYEMGTSFPTGMDKSSEIASPGYYSVELQNGIDVELSATERVGVHRYTNHSDTNLAILLDLGHRDEVLNSHISSLDGQRFTGFRISRAWAQEQHIYFALVFSDSCEMSLIYSTNQNGENGPISWAHFAFDKIKGESIEVKVAISSVSVEGALKNLNAEGSGKTFDQIKTEAETAWLEELSKVEVQGGSKEQQTIFYTAMYHSFIAPNLYNDVDGQYRGMDLEVHTLTEERDHYTVFSLWDTYRATHPLYTLLQPKRDVDFIKTLIDQYEKGGMLPIWELAANYTGCMIGYHSIPVIWDAYQKGLTDFDAEKALEAMVVSADADWRGLATYKEQGFIPADVEGESVSKTLEYAYDDWCIAQMAEALGKEDIAARFFERAQYWKNVYDPSTGFMRARVNSGWFSPFDPKEVNFNYTEANCWQYSFYVPQDIETLIDYHGGDDAFEAKLDQMFTESTETTGRDQADITGLIGQYAHGNEPSHHMAYLYNYVGKPYKTQEVVRQIMDELYTDQPDGLSGNEDCGQMSSWLVLSAMGIYPVCPGDGIYSFGTPWFEELTLNLENGNQFVISAPEVSKANFYVSSVSLNGDDHPRSFIEHSDIIQGGKLEFKMASSPQKSFGSALEHRPSSRIEQVSLLPPYLKSGDRVFIENTSIELASNNDDCTIWYQLFSKDGGPLTSGLLYDGPVPIEIDCNLKFWAERDGINSAILEAEFNRIPEGRTIELKTTYANQYAAGGDNALIDGIQGKGDFKTGTWQGYEGVNLDAVVDLGSKQYVKSISINFIMDENSWIFMPDEVQFEISDDGENFDLLGFVVPEMDIRQMGAVTEKFKVFLHNETRYIRVIGKNMGDCPEWHKSAGGQCWIFADEIVIEQ